MSAYDGSAAGSGAHISPSNKRWKARLVISLLMLVLAFVSLVFMNLYSSLYWPFTCIMTAADALLSLWLLWYVKRKRSSTYPGKLWHMVLHWLGVFALLWLIAVFIDRGVVSETEAGLFALLILSFALYLAGIYTDTTFMLIGITLGIMAAGTILIKAYLWVVMIPLIVLVALIILVIINRDRKRSSAKD